MFRPEYGSRPDVKHVAIILTDGTSQDPKATQEVAKACREANIQLFAIGIGEYVSYSELRGIASEPKSNCFFTASSYDTLDEIRENVIQETCEPGNTDFFLKINYKIVYVLTHWYIYKQYIL